MENLTDFEFYLKFTKPLILNLPEVNDRVLAAAWVKKLAKDSSGEENVRLDYLKLLLFVLQRKKLAPPFTQHPNALQTLENFPKDQTLVDVAKNILETEYKEKKEKLEKRLRGEGGDHPPYISDFSADLLEYVAVQNIENFGVHAYYAVSKQPLNSWYRVDKQLFPKAAKSMLEVSTPPPNLVEAVSTPEIPPEPPAETPQPPVETPPAEVPPEPEKEETPKKKKESPRKSTLGSSPPSRPIGRISPPPEDREPPTWGTNLLEAKFLEEEVGDIVTAAETFAGFDDFAPPGASTGIAAPTEILWTSPPFTFDDESAPFTFEDESPPLTFDDESLPFLVDEEMPSFLDTSAMTSAASLPYMTPPYPHVTPPPPRPPPKKVVKKPEPRPTRASLLLQKKTQKDQAPVEKPKPKIVRKPPAIAPRPTRSSQLMQKKKEAEEEKKPSKTKIVRKPPTTVPKPTRASLLLQKKKEAEKAPPPPPPKKGVAKKPSKGKVAKKPEPTPQLPADDVQEFVAEYSRILGEMEDQLEEVPVEVEPAPAVEKRPVSKIQKPKRQLSRVAKLSRQQIPKSHAAAVELEKSIHLSPDARQILQGIIEGPSTSTGITHPGPSPKLSHVEEEQEEVEEPSRFEFEGIDEVSDLWGESFPEDEYAQMETSLEYSGRGKDPRLVAAFNQMLDTSQKVSDLERVGLEELEADMADISGGDLDQLMGDLQAAVQEPQVLAVQAGPSSDALGATAVLDTAAIGEEDFEAMEKMIEEEMRRKGEDPHARAKRKMSKEEHKAQRQRLLDVHRKTDEQMDLLDIAAIDESDFEAMEKMIEEQMRRKGEDPHARPKRHVTEEEHKAQRQRLLDVHRRTDDQMEELEQAPDFVGKQRRKKVRRPPTVGGRSPLAEIREEDEEEWVPGSEFFAPSSQLDREDPRQKPAQYLFPEIEIPEDDLGLDDEYLPEGFLEDDFPDTDVASPATLRRTLDDIGNLYREHYASVPAFSNVPVTAPRPTTSPRRLPEAKGGPVPGLLEIPEFVPEDIGHIVQEFRRSPRPGPSWRPDTPPRAPEELVEIPTSPSQIVAKYSPGHFRYQYESPEMKYEKLKEAQKVDMGGVSPPRRDWWSKLDDLHKELYGIPQQKEPTVFDLPVDKVAYESPPRRLASPVSPHVSPPIDVEALKRAVMAQSVRPPQATYRRVVVPGRRPIQRYSHGPRGIGTIQEAEREPAEGLTAEELDLREQLERFEPIRERRAIQFPYKHRRTLQRHSAAPGLGAVGELYESPEKKVPDVFDLPPVEPRVVMESPPMEFPSPERVIPGEDWEQRMRIETAAPAPRRVPRMGLPRSRLPTIVSPPEYPDTSPTTRYPAAASPGGREGPRRKTLRRKLKKRRLDFSQAPTSPDEEAVEVTEVQTDVEERDLPSPPKLSDIELSPRQRHAVRRALGLSPSPEPAPPGPPRTPRRPEVFLHEEEEPVVDVLPEFSPPTPLSDYGVVERAMEEVRRHEPVQWRKPKVKVPRKYRGLKKLSDYYKKFPGALPATVAEEPLEEHTARIRDEVEREVEAEMAAQAAAERPPTGPLDEPLPGGLPSPMKPPVQVPFYETPPHLRRPEPRRPSPKIKVMPKAFRDVLLQEEMPELYTSPKISPEPRRPSPKTRVSPRGALLDEQMPELYTSPKTSPEPRRPSPRTRVSPRGALLDEEMPELYTSPRRLEEEIPEGGKSPETLEFERYEVLEAEPAPAAVPLQAHYIAEPAEAADRVQQRAAAQYAALADTPPQMTAADRVQQRAAAQYAALAGTPSPPRSPPRQPITTQYRRVVTPPRVRRMLEELRAEAGPPPTQFSPQLSYQPLVPEHIVEQALTEAQKAQAAQAAAAEFQYEERVQEQKAPKAVKSVKKIAKEMKGKGPAKKPAKAPEPKGGAKPRKPITSKKHVYKVVSKLDTGRKKKKEEAPPPPPPVLEYEYDLEALQDLGLGVEDLLDMDLLDEEPPELAPAGSPERPFDPRYPRRRVRPSRMAPRLPALTETEEEYRTSPMGFDMRWDLSPQRRVDMRAPDIKVLPSPIKESRFKFEKVSADLPEREAYVQPMPVARGHELYATALEEEEIPSELFYDMVEDDLAEARAEEAWLKLAGADEGVALAEEGLPAGIMLPARMSPEAIRRRIPIDRPPVSPSQLRGELEAHEVYDPERERMTRRIRIGGRYKPLRGATKPSMSPVYEGTPPRRIMPRTPEAAQKTTDLMATAAAQYEALLRDSPVRPRTPPTPSPEILKRRVQRHEYLPYKKKWEKKKAPGLGAAPEEVYEDAYLWSPPVEVTDELEFEEQPVYESPIDVKGFGMMGTVDIGGEEPPVFYSPLASPVVEYVDIWETGEEAPDLSPFELPTTPEELPPDPRIREIFPSPVAPARITRPEREASYPETHGLPQTESMRPPLPPTPKRSPVPKEQRKLPRRRLDFGPGPSEAPTGTSPTPGPSGRSPTPGPSGRPPGTPPTPDEGPSVVFLTVEAQIHEPRSPRRYAKPSSPDMIFEEEQPSILEAVSPVSPRREATAAAGAGHRWDELSPPRSPRRYAPSRIGEQPSFLEAVSPTSALSPGYGWGGTSPIPEDQRGFKWMSPTIVGEFPPRT